MNTPCPCCYHGDLLPVTQVTLSCSNCEYDEEAVLLSQWGEWELWAEGRGVRLFRAGMNWGWHASAEEAWKVVDAD